MTDARTADRRGVLYGALDRLHWMMLASWRNSFLSKAIMALSVSALFLANVAPVLADYGIALPQMTRMFMGSVLYLSGSLVFARNVPSQLSRGGEIHDIVSRMKALTDWEFFDGYRSSAQNRIASIKGSRLYPDAKKRLLEKRSDAAKGLTAHTPNWIDQTAGLYQSYVETLDYDRPVARICTAALLAAGTALLFWPVAVNVFEAAIGLVCR